jgi:Ricin-type beta-trefoil lectin domain
VRTRHRLIRGLGAFPVAVPAGIVLAVTLPAPAATSPLPVTVTDNTGRGEATFLYVLSENLTTHNADNNGTAAGTKILLWPCNGGGNRNWQFRSDGTLYNAQSNRCPDVPVRGLLQRQPADHRGLPCRGQPAMAPALRPPPASTTFT